MKIREYILILIMLVAPLGAFAHSGRTNAEGCHTNRKTGDYHCHQAKAARTTARTEARSETRSTIVCSFNYYNCSDFSSHGKAQAVFEQCGGVTSDIHDLDRDSDGLACENL